jgi:hypothetical protein
MGHEEGQDQFLPVLAVGSGIVVPCGDIRRTRKDQQEPTAVRHDELWRWCMAAGKLYLILELVGTNETVHLTLQNDFLENPLHNREYSPAETQTGNVVNEVVHDR